MADIDFELISPSAAQANDAVLVRRGASAPNTGALIAVSDIANATHTGDVTGSTDLTIANDAVTNAKLANMATATLKGRATAGTGDPEDLTGTQATALLDAFTSGAKGLAPASGGGTTNFLRADGTWAAPGGGGITRGTPVTVSGSPTEIELTGIPSDAERVTALLFGVSFASTDNLFFQLGNSGGYITTGYKGACLHWANTAQASSQNDTAFAANIGLDTRIAYGKVIFTKADDGIWTIDGSFSFTVSNSGTIPSGAVDGVGTLSRIKLLGSLGGAFDDGTVYYFWE